MWLQLLLSVLWKRFCKHTSDKPLPSSCTLHLHWFYIHLHECLLIVCWASLINNHLPSLSSFHCFLLADWLLLCASREFICITFDKRSPYPKILQRCVSICVQLLHFIKRMFCGCFFLPHVILWELSGDHMLKIYFYFHRITRFFFFVFAVIFPTTHVEVCFASLKNKSRNKLCWSLWKPACIRLSCELVFMKGCTDFCQISRKYWTTVMCVISSIRRSLFGCSGLTRQTENVQVWRW